MKNGRGSSENDKSMTHARRGSPGNERNHNMKKFTLLKAIVLAAGCAALTSAGIALKAGTLPSNAANMAANSGTTFVLTPTSDPSVATIAADGVVQTSLLGNCTEHADLVVTFPTTPGQPIEVTGSATFA